MNPNSELQFFLIANRVLEKYLKFSKNEDFNIQIIVILGDYYCYSNLECFLNFNIWLTLENEKVQV